MESYILWALSGVAISIIGMSITDGVTVLKENFFFAVLVGAIAGPVMLLFVIMAAISNDRQKIRETAEARKKEEAKNKAQTTKDKNKKIAKETYAQLTSELQEIQYSFESEETPLNEKFFKDCIKLATTVNLLTVEEVENGGSIFSLIKFARLNVSSSLSDEKKAESYAEKLGKSLQKVKKYKDIES